MCSRLCPQSHVRATIYTFVYVFPSPVFPCLMTNELPLPLYILTSHHLHELPYAQPPTSLIPFTPTTPLHIFQLVTTKPHALPIWLPHELHWCFTCKTLGIWLDSLHISTPCNPFNSSHHHHAPYFQLCLWQQHFPTYTSSLPSTLFFQHPHAMIFLPKIWLTTPTLPCLDSILQISLLLWFKLMFIACTPTSHTYLFVFHQYLICSSLPF